jgi:Putative DNA-binding domain
MTGYAAALTALQDAILSDDDAALAACIAPDATPGFSGPQRLAVYADGYQVRLCDVVAADYPATAQLLGTAQFAGLAQDCVRATPSRYWDLNLYAIGFADFLRQKNGILPWICELAALESAIVAVFWLPDSPPFVPDTHLTAEGLAELTVAPRVAARHMTLDYPVDEVLTALRAGENPLPGFRAGESPLPTVITPAPTPLFIVRHNNTVQRHSLDILEHALLSELLAGYSVNDAFERVSTAHPTAIDTLATRVQGWFARWVAEGFFKAA